jgi:hypothetical protein
MPGGTIWDRFTVDPRQAENARLRASDADREVVSDVLGTAYAEGRLTREELDERSDQVTQSRTLGDLPPIVDDLVAPTPVRAPAVGGSGHLRAEAEHRYRVQRQQALFGFLTPTLICWAVWAFTMPGEFPWPVFVMIGTGMRFVQLASNREGHTRSIERDLEKKERKRLAAGHQGGQQDGQQDGQDGPKQVG